MLVIDSREPTKIMRYAQELLGEFVVNTLSIGDIYDQEKGIIIERKEYSDFVNSVKSGHLNKQLLQMKDFKHAYLLISGTPDALFWQQQSWTAEQNAGAIASLLVRHPNIRIGFLPNDHQLMMCVKAIIEKVDDGQVIDLSKTELLKNTCTDDDVMVRMLCGINRVGNLKARKLLMNEEIKKKLTDIIDMVTSSISSTPKGVRLCVVH